MNWPWGTNFGPFLRGLAVTFGKMQADTRANKPLPDQPAPTMAELAATARVIQARLAAFSTWVEGHPGDITAADDFLAFLAAQGEPWARDIEATVNAAPGALSAAEEWAPTIISMLTAFQPAAIGIPGGLSGARGHI